MSSLSKSISKGNNTVNNGIIISSIIRDSSIDMNSARITTLGDPQNLLDAANKNYVDSLGIRFFIVNLIDMQENTFNSFLTGVYTLEIYSSVSNGPSAIFSLSKSRPSDGASIMRLCSSAGFITNERLLVNWPANQGMSLYKTGVSYNGNYIVKII